MNCSQCGATVPAGAAFCPQCGSKLGSGKRAAAEIPDAVERLRPAAARDGGRNAPEEELWSGRYSFKAMPSDLVSLIFTSKFGFLIFTVIVAGVAATFIGPPVGKIVSIGAVVLFALLGIVFLFRRLRVRYRLTTQRLFRETGIFGRSSDRNLVVEIDDITVRQGVIDRMFNVGTVILNTSDNTTPVLEIKGIESPRQVADLIEDARRKERDRRFLYTTNA